MQNTSSESSLPKETWWKTSPLPPCTCQNRVLNELGCLNGPAQRRGPQSTGPQLHQLHNYQTVRLVKTASKIAVKNLTGEFYPPSSLSPAHLPCIWGVPVHQNQCYHLGSTCDSCQHLATFIWRCSDFKGNATLAPSRRCRRSSMFFGASSKPLPQPT